ncbi:MAG: hypothetical protein AAGA96_16365 [Verrucomicrobiota bacterium]
MSDSLRTPVLVIAYKRAETTRKVLEVVRRAGVTRLYIAFNAPNPENPIEAQKCHEVQALVNTIDWDCEVTAFKRQEHVNARTSISSAITWFFENVEEGIILEDDCVVSDSFFPFAKELLERYRHDERVMQIGASNFHTQEPILEESYYFSKYCYIWGWATWSRAWKHFRIDLGDIDKAELEQSLKSSFSTHAEYTYWRLMFNYVETGKIDTWDYQWMFRVWLNGGLSIVPSRNLVKNIGFGEGATNTISNKSHHRDLRSCNLTFPLVHPAVVAHDSTADQQDSKDFRGIFRSYRSRHFRIRVATLLPNFLRTILKRAIS